MESAPVPPGWTRLIEKGRVLYSSPSEPIFVRIYSRAELSLFHRKVHFLDVKEDDLVFTRERKLKEKNFLPDSGAECVVQSLDNVMDKWKVSIGNNKKVKIDEEFVDTSQDVGNFLSLHKEDILNSTTLIGSPQVDQTTREDAHDTVEVKEMEMPQSHGNISNSLDDKIRIKLNKEQSKLADAIKKLTIDPKRAVNHKLVLESAAKRLNQARVELVEEDTVDVDSLLNMVKDCHSVEEMTKVLCTNPEIHNKFFKLFSSKLLEELLSLRSEPENPLTRFPLDVNPYVCADVVHVLPTESGTYKRGNVRVVCERICGSQF